MRTIPLSQGKNALVSNRDYPTLIKYKWSSSLKRKGTSNELWIAVRSVRDLSVKGGRRIIIMHRQILGFPKSQIDHINHNSLDNRRENLRIVSPSQNGANKRCQKNNKSGFRGVWFDKDLRKYRANIRPENKTIHLGCFSTAEEAAIAWNDKAKELWGDFAYQNQICK